MADTLPQTTAPTPVAVEQPSYAHPVAAFFLFFFKAAAVFIYIFCGWFGTDFVINFCTITFLLVCDFWTVKNVSGRLMVGLRWWNEVSEMGGSDWKFESLEEGQRAVNKKDSFVFWTLLYATPAVWCALGFIAILKLNIDYLLLVIIAVLLSGANLMGYLKCSKAAQNQIKGRFNSLFASGLRAYMFSGRS
ncbi:hypothetical protein CHLNCDRAFT_19961 [Chlorella variabilis]|uniref:Golgi apparatus membrane protein TVP23 n=1 Tax=Chlorella variabilis TaxID=554065 RepID=E1Z5T1_CHLVA|nr:hypothetical protein CHLNCDRAFT_19961 [Chlorella variabilis]EFN58811.1 hypothetical protein CHLNCDRAFT_19961 [Chlorella variabilis]|eukprot:XP_005850913.1 hypothetical protein CHLNCDRAFT_19961 [Chlorella variabilis]